MRHMDGFEREREREKVRNAHGALPATVTAQPPKLPQCLKTLIDHVNRTWTDLPTRTNQLTLCAVDPPAAGCLPSQRQLPETYRLLDFHFPTPLLARVGR